MSSYIVRSAERSHHRIFPGVDIFTAAGDQIMLSLVEFEPGHIPGLAFFEMERELSEILGRKVDLNTPGFLSPYFRENVMVEAEVQYEQAEQ